MRRLALIDVDDQLEHLGDTLRALSVDLRCGSQHSEVTDQLRQVKSELDVLIGHMRECKIT